MKRGPGEEYGGRGRKKIASGASLASFVYSLRLFSLVETDTEEKRRTGFSARRRTQNSVENEGAEVIRPKATGRDLKRRKTRRQYVEAGASMVGCKPADEEENEKRPYSPRSYGAAEGKVPELGSKTST
ncbi:hypothetical protein PoB_003283800 [Plakobranchus ocellatus]|uniref:Uncharacterized protein n=1 Tax=Plakobranchus ocellatus TaxID=259542 RepID=A0AAV4AHR3_9GAST|nr:hypothetical protein PoB_003283800 [Plakobranchus ocellatus]